jgi:hypothetical protein
VKEVLVSFSASMQVVMSLGFWIPVFLVIERLELVMGIGGDDDGGGTGCGLGVEVDRLVVSHTNISMWLCEWTYIEFCR